MNVIFMCIDLSFTIIVCCWRVSWNKFGITTHFLCSAYYIVVASTPNFQL